MAERGTASILPSPARFLLDPIAGLRPSVPAESARSAGRRALAPMSRPRRDRPRGARLQPTPAVILADVMRALASETRLDIARALGQRPQSTSELAAVLALRPSTISRHLHVLTHAGIVAPRRAGHYVLYELRMGPIVDAWHAVEHYVAPLVDERGSPLSAERGLVSRS